MKLLAHWRESMAVLFLFSSSRLIYALLGLQFDASTFPGYIQFIDQELLTNRMIESIWYSHAHPPLLNLFTGIGVKLFSQHADVFFAICFHIFGYILALCVFILTNRLARSRIAAYTVTTLLVASPAFVLYEN